MASGEGVKEGTGGREKAPSGRPKGIGIKRTGER